MPEITLSLSSHTVLVLLALPAAVLVAVWAYRHTTPVVSRSVRYFLAGLRAATQMLLIALLGEPILSILSRSEEPPETVVLIDNSLSMGIRDSFEDRRQGLETLLSSPEFDALRSTQA
ncbi:MAG: hypothetical protein IH628_04765, partial [Proteobacteria bacterium]|nr:hypothetical protein [Pseudomonadota bacterium]